MTTVIKQVAAGALTRQDCTLQVLHEHLVTISIRPPGRRSQAREPQQGTPPVVTEATPVTNENCQWQRLVRASALKIDGDEAFKLRAVADAFAVLQRGSHTAGTNNERRSRFSPAASFVSVCRSGGHNFLQQTGGVRSLKFTAVNWSKRLVDPVRVTDC
ncbi:hypothetical protein MTO96_020963 [Rhipicephalus appendiculatus]